MEILEKHLLYSLCGKWPHRHKRKEILTRVLSLIKKKSIQGLLISDCVLVFSFSGFGFLGTRSGLPGFLCACISQTVFFRLLSLPQAIHSLWTSHPQTHMSRAQPYRWGQSASSRFLWGCFLSPEGPSWSLGLKFLFPWCRNSSFSSPLPPKQPNPHCLQGKCSLCRPLGASKEEYTLCIT